MKLLIKTNIKFEIIDNYKDYYIFIVDNKKHYIPKNADTIDFINSRILVNGKIYTDLSE